MPELLQIPSQTQLRAPTSFTGTWATLYRDSLNALLERYARRGPQYQMLCDLAASLYVQVRRMEATGAIQGLESLDELIERQLADGATDPDEARANAQRQLKNAAQAVRLYLDATEALRRLIEQSQRYTEARKAEVVVTEVNNAVLETLRIVETMVDPGTFSRIVGAVRAALDQNRSPA